MIVPSRCTAVAALAATALAACGDDHHVATAALSPTSPPTAAAATARAGATGGVRKTRYGRIIVDGKGLALYFFTADGAGPSTCYGRCASVELDVASRRQCNLPLGPIDAGEAQVRMEAEGERHGRTAVGVIRVDIVSRCAAGTTLIVRACGNGKDGC